MGYLVTASLFRGEPRLPRRIALDGKALGWALYRDVRADAWLLDAFTAPPRYPFTQDPFDLLAEPPAELERFFAVIDAVGAEFIAPAGLIALNKYLSTVAEGHVLSLTANDDTLSFACRSARGALQYVVARGLDFILTWEAGAVRVQPLLVEEDPDIENPDLESLAGEISGVTVAARDVAYASGLHLIARQQALAFLDGKETWLDLGSFDCLGRVPDPRARSD